MKPIDLSKLNYTRLQKYRKSLTNKISNYDTCWCGISGCDHNNKENQNNPHYLELKTEYNRVLEECRIRNLSIAKEKEKKQKFHVPTVKELSIK